jgi:GNAT superfamily N-acetyltransferase
MIHIRAADEQDSAPIARVHVDSWRTTYRGIISDSYLAALSYQQREQGWQEVFRTTEDLQFAYVAEAENNQVIGFAAGGLNRNEEIDYEGELYAIYLLFEYQRKGIGRLLTKAVVKRLLQEGVHSMLVWVLEGNPACRFYEAVGGRKISEKEIIIGEEAYKEVAYGWREIEKLWGAT